MTTDPIIPRPRKTGFRVRTPNLDLVHRIMRFVEEHPGSDAETIAAALGASLLQIVETTEWMLRKGALEFS